MIPPEFALGNNENASAIPKNLCSKRSLIAPGHRCIHYAFRAGPEAKRRGPAGWSVSPAATAAQSAPTRLLAGPSQLGQPTHHCELTATQPEPAHTPPPKMHVHKPRPQNQPIATREPGVRQTRRRQGATRGAPGGRPPGKHCEPYAKAPQKGAEDRATPGGYGGKPPGVAIIGVPTGARNAGSGTPTGDQSTDMNATRKHPLVCQDLIHNQISGGG